MSSFQTAKQVVKASIQDEIQESSMHGMWIRSKLAALEAIKTEADLATEEQITKGEPFNAHLTVSQMIQTQMKKE